MEDDSLLLCRVVNRRPYDFDESWTTVTLILPASGKNRPCSVPPPSEDEHDERDRQGDRSLRLSHSQMLFSPSMMVDILFLVAVDAFVTDVAFVLSVLSFAVAFNFCAIFKSYLDSLSGTSLTIILSV